MGADQSVAQQFVHARFVLGWKKLGHEKRLRAYIVNYADDLMICCRGNAEGVLAAMRDIMRKLKLTVNETTTRGCRLPEEKFGSLGYTCGRCYSPQTGRAFLATDPFKKRGIRIYEPIGSETGRNRTDQETAVGDKLFAIPWSALKADTGEEPFILDVDKKLLEGAPGFDKDQWPNRRKEQTR